MQKIYRLKQFSILTVSLLLSLGMSAIPSWANDTDTRNVRQGLPGRRISGGVRTDSGSCLTDFNQTVVAVAPQNPISKTASAHPTFWFSLPETVGDKTVEFSLFNESEELIYSAQIEASNDHAISEFKLPKSAPSLAVNRNYNWVFSLSCDNGSQIAPVLGLEGWIQRVDISTELASQIEAASPEQRIELYRSAGLWHEQVTELANLRRSQELHPQEALGQEASGQEALNNHLLSDWTALMQSTGLTDYLANQLSESMVVIETVAFSPRSSY